MKKQLLVVALLLVASGLLAKTTVIYHTSDTHGFYYPKNGVGGFAALANVIKKGPQPYLLLDSGDFANGTAETRSSKGLKSVQLMNAVGYHATTIGNHEFDFKDPGVEPMLRALEFPVLAANFFEAGTQKYPVNVAPYHLFNVDGVKVAVIGLANNNPTNKSSLYSFTKPLAALEKSLNEVEALHPQAVVVIVHDSLHDDKHGTKPYVAEIATKFPGRVHVVLGGHAHKLFQNEYIEGTLFTESGCYVKQVSKITVTTDDKTGEFVSAFSEVIPLEISKTGQDKEIAALAASLQEPGMEEVFGQAVEDINLVSSVPEHKDGPLNNWIADLGRAYAGTQIFVHNNGGARVNMQKGIITKRDLVDIHPFENRVIKMTVNGRFLKYLVKNSLLPRSLFTYSGMTVTYRNKKGKVKDLQILIDGKPIKNRARYTLATNEYIGMGGSEGWPFKRVKDNQKELVGTGTMRSILEEGVKKQSPVHALPTGRIVELP